MLYLYSIAALLYLSACVRLQLPVQSVPITTKVVRSNPTYAEM